MTDMLENDLHMEALLERVEYMEASYRNLVDNINNIISVRAFVKDVNEIRDIPAILGNSGVLIKRLIPFKELAFYLVDDADSSFINSYCDPVSAKEALQLDVDANIANGTFAWALRQNRPIVVPSKRRGLTLVFHVLGTQSRVRGMFVGLIDSDNLNINDPSIIVLSAMVQNISSTLESAVLYRILMESRERYRRLIAAVTDYIYTVEVRDGSVTAVTHNEGCEVLTGYTLEELRADTSLTGNMVFNEDREKVQRHIETVFSEKVLSSVEYRIVRKDGKVIWVNNTIVPLKDEHGSLVSFENLLSDITRTRGLEEQLRQSQKMEAIGHLAGGLAHDINNILSVIISACELVEMKTEDRDRIGAYTGDIFESAKKAANLTKSLLAFSRKQAVDLKPVNANDIISGAQKILGRLIRENIEIKTALSPSDLIIKADKGQIEQAIINLANNASDAMPQGGVLTLATRKIGIDKTGNPEDNTRDGVPASYDCVEISVTDTGEGMDEKTKEHLFEPFFTTKETGKGTGLGLSMVYGTIKQHNGFINVFSEQGKGSAFRIYFPLIAETATREDARRAVLRREGNETILMAEDNKKVRSGLSEILRHCGYKIIEADDGEHALQLFSENMDLINLIISDVVMPKKQGVEFYEEARKLRPGIKVIFMSGYSDDIINIKGFVHEDASFLNKPIDSADLLSKIREVLDRQ